MQLLSTCLALYRITQKKELTKLSHYRSIVSPLSTILSFNLTPADLHVFEEFIHCSQIFPLTEEIAMKTIELRRHQKLKLPDAIIAATALVFDLTLITRNVADFRNVQGLKIINPYEIAS